MPLIQYCGLTIDEDQLKLTTAASNLHSLDQPLELALPIGPGTFIKVSSNWFEDIEDGTHAVGLQINGQRSIPSSVWGAIDKPEHGACYKKEAPNERENYVVCTTPPSSSFIHYFFRKLEITEKFPTRIRFELRVSVLELFTLLDSKSKGESKILQVWRGEMEKSNPTRDGLSLRDKSHATNNTNTTPSSSSDFVLQWGNRKRLRCTKVQQQQGKDKELVAASGTPPVGQSSISTRVDRRGVSNGHGYINLRQRSSSPAHRVLRNSETSIAMKGQSNGDKRGAHHNYNGKNHYNGGGGGGGSGSSETANDSKNGVGYPGWVAVRSYFGTVRSQRKKDHKEETERIKGYGKHGVRVRIRVFVFV
ncbi:hypothetical protein L1987_55837 [Smallanthus sonchifolius]|uniref:Uncharacterized protein n=1 Tax=Smallanthus sonchifolius TaxID=185202 RepID=A0ACB9EBG2_9ASTR|nr:hypothetical protein L1987_55837 [Smallanthus sonchifolius]